ncbi:MAG: hypothetical protein JXR30_02555 [Alphaproteobacteria bacterium]|nr:hypothetical protein [Alphaproteobacteria bacterium]
MINSSRNHGRMLLEVLLVLVIISSILPFIYKQNLKRKELLETASVASEILKIKSSFKSYLENTTSLFSNTTSTQIKKVPFKDLYMNNLPSSIQENNKFGMQYSLFAKRSVSSQNHPQIEGLILLSSGDFPPLKQRQTASLLGPEGGYIEDSFIYSSSRSWMVLLSDWKISNTSEGVVFKFEIQGDSQGYIHRIETNETQNHTMQTNLYMGYHNIKDVKEIDAEHIDIFESLYYLEGATEQSSGNLSAGVENLEVKNESKEIDLSDSDTGFGVYSCLENEDNEYLNCPTIETLQTDQLNVLGNITVGNELTAEDLSVKQTIYLEGDLTTPKLKVYKIEVDSIEFQAPKNDNPYNDLPYGEDEGYTITTPNLLVDTLNIGSLSTELGIFDDLDITNGKVYDKERRIPIGIYSDTLSTNGNNTLSVNDIILQDINTWVWDTDTEKERINLLPCSKESDCVNCCTNLLYDCLTKGIEIDIPVSLDFPGFSVTTKPKYSPSFEKESEVITEFGEHSIIPGFIDTIRLGDIIQCLETIKTIKTKLERTLN